MRYLLSLMMHTLCIGVNYRDNGNNNFLVPANATYTEADLDMITSILFNPEYCGFTWKKFL